MTRKKLDRLFKEHERHLTLHELDVARSLLKYLGPKMLRVLVKMVIAEKEQRVPLRNEHSTEP